MFRLSSACLAALMAVLVTACDQGPSGEVHARPPTRVAADETYVFYFHDGRGSHAREAAEALAAKGFQVILPERTEKTDPDYHAVAVKEQVRELLARGVSMNRIGLVGAGEGGRLAMMVSGLTQVPASALVVLAGCPSKGTPERPAYERVLRLHAATIKGRFLSIVAKDHAGTGSCSEAFARANGSEPWETELPAVLPEAPFTTPSGAWVEETAAWIADR